MRVLYSFNIFLYGLAIKVAALFNAKAKLWVNGRKNLLDELQEKIGLENKKIAWFHCASLGEFEQGRPLIEKFKSENPDIKILLTFFSPSGYEVRKNYSGADIVCYLPLDTVGNARKFISITKPTFAVFVKYEFWLNHLSELNKNRIPHFLICSIFRKDQIFFKFYGKIFREALLNYSWIFTQEKESLNLLNSISVANIEVAGDTRFDRVIEIANGAKDIPVAAAFSKGHKVIVAGSTWKSDEDILLPALKPYLENGWRLIIAPHEISKSRIEQIESNSDLAGVDIQDTWTYSDALKSIDHFQGKILIIDNMGMLSSLYKYGSVAYIGGGFGKSIHNILEAAVYGMPVIFGPNHEKFYEAQNLLKLGAAITVNDQDEMEKSFKEITSDQKKMEVLSKIAKEFVVENSGATNKILIKINSLINH